MLRDLFFFLNLENACPKKKKDNAAKFNLRNKKENQAISNNCFIWKNRFKFLNFLFNFFSQQQEEHENMKQITERQF